MYHLCLVAAFFVPSLALAASPPNFVVIVADDMGYSDAGCYGGEIATPNLDRLAAGGLRFTQMYSTARCWPSRTCLLTGYYPQQVHMDPPQGRLPRWTRVLPKYFQPLGYRTYHSGKWHLQGAPRPVADGGFDHSYCVEDHNNFFAPKNAMLDDAKLPPVPEGTNFYLTTAIADYAIGFLKEHAEKQAGKPFVLYLAFTSPHFPLHALQADIDRYREKYKVGWDAVRTARHKRMQEMGLVTCALPPGERNTIPSWSLSEKELQEKIGPGEAGYAVPWNQLTQAQQDFQAEKMAIHAAMVDRMDQEIGRVLAQLKAMNAFDNTFISFVSDNGASAEQIIRGAGHDPKLPLGSSHTFLCLGPGWSTAANTPLRLHKSWVHEGGISSPLVVHWPAGIKAAGQLRHTVGHFVDLLPTMVALAGGNPDKGAPEGAPELPGRSLVPALAADARIERPYVYWHHINNRAIRVGDWKLVSAGGPKQEGPWELYNTAADRCEQHNEAAAQPDKVAQLSALWQKCDDEFRRQAGPVDPFPGQKKGGKKK